MVEIKYREHREEADLSGKTLAEVRKEYAARFDVPQKAAIKLNDRKVKPEQESLIKLHDCDVVGFASATKLRGPILVGALLLALALTGGTFAFGYLTNSSTLAITSAGGDFATVTAASGQPTWTVWGSLKGAIGSGNLFVVNTSTTNYTGNLAVTVSIANGDQLVKVYRALSLLLEVADSSGERIDITSDNAVGNDDYALLTLDNGAANLYIDQISGSDNYTIKVKSGFYVSNIYGTGWTTGYQQPVLYATVAQR